MFNFKKKYDSSKQNLKCYDYSHYAIKISFILHLTFIIQKFPFLLLFNAHTKKCVCVYKYCNVTL